MPLRAAPVPAASHPVSLRIHEHDEAPDFCLRGTTGDLRLHDLRGQWVVLYFYPEDHTPGCTVEARRFRAYFEAVCKRPPSWASAATTRRTTAASGIGTSSPSSS